MKEKHKHFLILSVIFVFAALRGNKLFSQTQKQSNNVASFQIIKLKGKVFGRSPLSLLWRPITENFLLYQGSILHLPSGSKATILSAPNRFTHQSQVVLRGPTTIRIHQDTLKPVILSNEPDSKSSFTTDLVAGFRLSLKDIVKNTENLKNQQGNDPGDEKPGSGLALLDELLLVYPKKDVTIFTDQLPHPFKVNWKVTPNYLSNTIFQVYFGKKGLERNIRPILTKENSHTLVIDSYGQYFLKIRSKQLKLNSKKIEIEFRKPRDFQNFTQSLIEKKEKKDSTFTNWYTKLIQLQAPKSSQYFFQSEKGSIVHFSWKAPKSLMSKEYFFKLITQKNSLRSVIRTKRNLASLKLEPGRHIWYVELYKEKEPKKVLARSTKRSLYVSASQKSAIRGAFQRMRQRLEFEKSGESVWIR